MLIWSDEKQFTGATAMHSTQDTHPGLSLADVLEPGKHITIKSICSKAAPKRIIVTVYVVTFHCHF